MSKSWNNTNYYDRKSKDKKKFSVCYLILEKKENIFSFKKEQKEQKTDILVAGKVIQ